MKTVEFAISPNQQQQSILKEWFEALRWVWNKGLDLCQEFERFSAWDKVSKTWVPCCPLFGDLKVRWIKDEDNWIAAPYSPIATRRNPTRLFCPLPPASSYRVPELTSVSEFSLASYFAHKRHPDKPWLKSIPANFIRGITAALAKSWKEYKGGSRGMPRFKGKANPLQTLTNNDAKILRREGDRIRIPNLGLIRLRELMPRWGLTEICTLKICSRPSGWYVQLTGEIPDTNKIKPSDRVVGLSFFKSGVHHSTDKRDVPAPRYLEKATKKLVRLQRKLSRQQFLSSNWHKTKKAIGSLHEKIRLQRRNFNHKLSTYIVRTYGAIALQSIQPGTKRRPAPIIAPGTHPPHYNPNGATERSLKNRYATDLGLGQFISFVKQKATEHGRTLQEIAACQKIATSMTASKLQAEMVSAISAGGYGECDPKLTSLKELRSDSMQEKVERSTHPNVVGTTLSKSTITRSGIKLAEQSKNATSDKDIKTKAEIKTKRRKTTNNKMKKAPSNLEPP